MTELKLRDYQSEAIQAVFEAWGDGMKRPAVVLPTGAGKTVVFAALIKQFREWTQLPPVPGFGSRGDRVVVLVHRDELADQAIAKIRAVAPGISVGKVKAQDDEISADVMVCSVQTLASRRRRLRLEIEQQRSGAVGLIITDECHHAAAASYGAVYASFPDALHLGVTATMARGDRVGLGSVWDDVVYQKSILWMISKGHLTDVKAHAVKVDGLDLGSVKASRGDYQAGDLGDALEAAGADKVIAHAYREHAGERPGVVFTPTVATALATAEALASAGIRSAVISGETPRQERQGIFEDFRTGRTQVLVNCMVLTEGFDAPWASCAVIARPTQSNPLYVQMVGRVLRPYPGKEDALILDVVGASASNKLRTLVDLEPGMVRSIMPGELLADAVVREAEEGDQKAPAGSIAFELKHRELNLFAASEHAWSRTHAGVLFISCGETTVFLWPSPEQPGTWDVCQAPKGKKWERTTYTTLDIGSAMAWGEAVSESFSGYSTQKGAAWRRRRPSDKQLKFARNVGVPRPETLRSGELHDRLSVIQASRLFDRFVKATG